MKQWEDPRYQDKGGTAIARRSLRRASDKSKAKWKGPNLKEIMPHDGESLAAQNPEDSFSMTIDIPENEHD